MNLSTLEKLLHEVSRIGFYPGKLLNDACSRIAKLLEQDTSFENTSPEETLAWFEQQSKQVYAQYDAYRNRIQQMTLFALALFEAQPDRDRYGLTLLFSFAYVQQNAAKQKALDFAARFANLIRTADLQVDMSGSFLHQQFDFDPQYLDQLEWLANCLVTAPNITVQPWQSTMMFASFQMSQTFKPMFQEWYEMVNDLGAGSSEKIGPLQQRVWNNMRDAQSLFDQKESANTEADLKMSVDAILEMQKGEIPANLAELMRMFERRTGYDPLTFMALCNVSDAEEIQVELIEKRQRAVIEAEKNAAQEEFDLYERALKSFEQEKIRKVAKSEQYEQFKSAARLHYKRNSETWITDMSLFDIDLDSDQKDRLFAFYEKFFAASIKLEQLTDELNGTTRQSKRTLKRIEQDLETANRGAIIAENLMKKTMQEMSITLQDAQVQQLMFLLLDKKIRIQDLEETLKKQFPRLHAAGFKALKTPMQYYFDAVDSVKYYEMEREAHLKSKAYWKILLTVLFFALWGLVAILAIPMLLGAAEFAFDRILSVPEPNPEWVLNATNATTNATAEKLVENVANYTTYAEGFASVSTAFDSALNWTTSKAWTLMKSAGTALVGNTRLGKLFQNAGLVQFDYNRLRPSEVFGAIRNFEFRNLAIVAVYYILMYRVASVLFPLWIGFSISSARIATEAWFEDNLIDSVAMESVIVRTNLGGMRQQFIDAGAEFAISLVQSQNQTASLIFSAANFLKYGKAGIIPAVWSIAGANSTMPEDWKSYIASKGRQMPDLWITNQDNMRKGIEYVQSARGDPKMIENVSRSAVIKAVAWKDEKNVGKPASIPLPTVTDVYSDEEEEE